MVAVVLLSCKAIDINPFKFDSNVCDIRQPRGLNLKMEDNIWQSGLVFFFI